MASSYKYFSNHDRVVAVNNLTEEVSNVSGTAWASSSYAPKYFTQYASGSDEFALATKVFDISTGRSPDTTGSLADAVGEKTIYNEFAKVLLGTDYNNTVKKFNLDIDDGSGNKVLHNAYFVNFARAQTKDRIQVGSFKLHVNTDDGEIVLNDEDSVNDVRECLTGEFGYLKVSSSAVSTVAGVNDVQGLLFYEAGVAVISPYIFAEYSSSNANPSGSNDYINKNILGILSSPTILSGTNDVRDMFVSGTIDENNYGFAQHITTASYNAVTELNSTIYFCRAYNHEFNYSSNPTYLKDSEIVVKNGVPEAQPRTYITTVGLYSDDNQLLAVAKLSEPILKTPENELIARVRLDF